MEPAPPTPPPLDYGTRPPLAWAGRNKRKLIAMAVVIGILAPTLWYRRPLWNWVQWQYWMRQAAAHQMQDDLPLMVNDPEEIARLRGHPDYIPASSVGKQPESLYYAPRALRELARLNPSFAVFADGPVTFLGTLHRPDGQPRLVAVRAPVVAISSSGRALLAWAHISKLHVVVAAPSAFDLRIPAAQKPSTMPGLVSIKQLRQLGLTPVHPTEVFRARTDPADASHLVITNVRNGEIMHLFLRNDDTVRQEQELVQPSQQQNDPTTK